MVIIVQYYLTLALTLCIVLFSITGCNDSSISESEKSETNSHITKVVTKSETNQDISNQAKEMLQDYDDISSINAVNTDKELIIAFDVPQLDRLRLAKIRQRVSKDVKKEFDSYDVEVSTDKKIILELEKIEEKLQNNSLTKKELKKEVKRITRLAQEQT